MKFKFGLPLFAFLVVVVCSLGSVSAANDIHDVTIEDTNTDIQHPEAHIQDSVIYNRLANTDNTVIREATGGTSYGNIINSRIFNQITSSTYTFIIQGNNEDGIVQDSIINNVLSFNSESYVVQGWSGAVQNCMLNNAVNDFDGQYYIEQGWNGAVQDSMINNAINGFTGRSFIEQGSYDSSTIQRSMINNAVLDFEGMNVINQGSYGANISPGPHFGFIQDSMLNNAVVSCSGSSNIEQNDVDKSYLSNLVYNSEGEYSIIQNDISNSLICNSTLFSDNTTITQTNLTGVNGCLIAIGCTNYTKTIDNLVDTNFFNLVIGNHVIFDLKW